MGIFVHAATEAMKLNGEITCGKLGAPKPLDKDKSNGYALDHAAPKPLDKDKLNGYALDHAAPKPLDKDKLNGCALDQAARWSYQRQSKCRP